MSATDSNPARQVTLNVNGQTRQVDVASTELLADTLRRELGLTSVRITCGLGICGSCTVLVDGKSVSSCLTMSWQNSGREVTTSEGLVNEDGSPGPIHEAFLAEHAYQCSYCIPGMVVTVQSYLNSLDGEPADVDELREYLAGNLCRCGSYGQIVDAIVKIVTGSGGHDTSG